MTTQSPLPPALPRARQAWPPPYAQDVVAHLEAVLPSADDEDNEVLLARLVDGRSRPSPVDLGAHLQVLAS